MNGAHVDEMAALYALGLLDDRETGRLEEHLRDCPRCAVPRGPQRRSASRSRLRRWFSVLGAGSLPGSRSWRCKRSRLIMRVRSPTRFSRWSTSGRTSRSTPSNLVAGRSGSRNAARATAARRSGRSCRTSGRSCACSPSASAAPSDPFARSEQVALQMSQEVAEVFDRPAPLGEAHTPCWGRYYGPDFRGRGSPLDRT